jgi:hypothetical protein
MLWACIVLPQLALDAVLRRCPDPSRPLALVGGPVQLRTLHAVNAAAAAAGLAAGMRLPAAHALLPEVALVPTRCGGAFATFACGAGRAATAAELHGRNRRRGNFGHCSGHFSALIGAPRPIGARAPTARHTGPLSKAGRVTAPSAA